jgi:hypothetical protein
MLGPLPHSDAAVAWELVLRTLPTLPILPMLAGAGETITAVGADGLHGYGGDEHGLVVDREALLRALPAIDAAYLRGASDESALALTALPGMPQHEAALRRCRALGGSIVGPISLGFQLVDHDEVPLVQDGVVLSALAQHLFLRRQWLYSALRRYNERALVWLYEPFADAITGPFCPMPVDTLCAAVDQTLGYNQPRALWLNAVEAVSPLFETMKISLLGLPLPQPQHAEALAPLLRRLVADRGGVGWGVVPTQAGMLEQTSVGRVAARFDEWLRALEAQGLVPDDVAAASFIMPDDTLAYLEAREAEHVLSLTAEVASVIRQSYAVE